MTPAAEYAFSLLNGWRGKPSGDRFMFALMQDSSHFTDIEDRTGKLLRELNEYPRPSMDQRALVIEAFTVLNFDKAHRIQAYLADTKLGALLADATGLLAAALWADTGPRANRSFQKSMPIYFGERMVAYTRASLLPTNSSYALEDAFFSRLAVLLKNYLSAVRFTGDTKEESARRTKLMLNALDLQDFAELPDQAAKHVVELVTKTALNILPLNERIEMLLGKPHTRHTGSRIRLWGVVEAHAQFDPRDLGISGPRVVFASVLDAERYVHFYHKLLLKAVQLDRDREHQLGYAIDGIKVTPADRIPVPQENGSLHDRTVITDLTRENQQGLEAMAHLLFEYYEVPSEEQHLPKAGQRHGAVTFEWIPPSVFSTKA